MTTAARLRAVWIALVAVTLVLLPRLASACPTCAADQKGNVLKVVGVFLAIPFVIVTIVIPMIVRASREVGE